MPSTSTDRIDGLTTSVAIKAPCRVATTANITLSGLQTIDGVTVEAGDRVLVKNQTAAAENGIWIAQSTAWSRARDFSGARDAVQGTLINVYSSSGENVTMVYRLVTANPVYIGTSEIEFEPTSLVSGSASAISYANNGAAITTEEALDILYYGISNITNARYAGGAVDGAADNRAAFVAALAERSAAGGGIVYMPIGTWNLLFSTTTLFTVPAKVKVMGQGEGTILNIDGNGVVGNKTAFDMTGAGASLENFSATFDVDDGIAFNIKASNLSFRGLVLNGGHTSLNTTTFHGWVLGSNDTLDGLTIEKNRITNFRYGLLRANTTTGTQTRVSVRDNLWENNYANHIAFNTPNGTIDDVDVIGNTFGDCPGGDAFSTFAIMLGMASCTNYRIIGNHFSGICKEAIHLEEAGGNIIISGNTFDDLTKGANTNGGRGIYIIDNSVGGVAVGPARFVICDNAMAGNSAANSDYGIYIVSSTTLPADQYSIDGNIISTFATGISAILSSKAAVTNNEIISCTTGLAVPDTSTALRTGAIVSGNLISDCTTGMDVNRGWPQIENNTLKNCTTGIQSDRPGMFGRHSFIDVTTPMSSSGGAAEIMGWFYEKTGLTIAATPSSTVIDTLNFPDCCYGAFSVLLGDADGATTRVMRHWTLGITGGGVVTATLNAERSIGTIATSGSPATNAGKLAVTFTNSGAANSVCYIQASFDGTYAL